MPNCAAFCPLLFCLPDPLPSKGCWRLDDLKKVTGGWRAESTTVNLQAHPTHQTRQTINHLDHPTISLLLSLPTTCISLKNYTHLSIPNLKNSRRESFSHRRYGFRF